MDVDDVEGAIREIEEACIHEPVVDPTTFSPGLSEHGGREVHAGDSGTSGREREGGLASPGAYIEDSFSGRDPGEFDRRLPQPSAEPF